MGRIGFIGADAHTESLIRSLFKAVPDAQIFLSPGSSESAQRMATQYPCWTLDSHQAVVDEADIIFVVTDRKGLHEISLGSVLGSGQTLISLIPGVQLRELQQIFNHAKVVRALLVNIHDSNKPLAFMTDSDDEIQQLFSVFSKVSMQMRESDFNLVEKNVS
ncbi:NADP oxidoreductase [Enterobacteriaceae bacterium H4N4]|uniref:NADP oxidoreductase n=1 Tax=Silvania confinis TaxID=2926470 RepID=A0A9J6QDA3_9ENTR|nr:NAD(P)-binding domain-containing protein [Silvania confinis]MCU6668227.1 NADP oxidoreductase [Silvania confinis]